MTAELTRYNPKERAKPKSGKEHYIFSCENIKIAVLSSQSRMGATATAMGITTWLHNVGASVCYVEANNSTHLATLARAYEMEQTEGGYLYDGVDYCTTAPDNGMNFIVCDMGATAQAQMVQANSADILLLVCGTKPYELSLTLRLKKQFETAHAFILCPFVDEDSKATYAEVLQSDYHKVLFSHYHPALMDSATNATLSKPRKPPCKVTRTPVQLAPFTMPLFYSLLKQAKGNAGQFLPCKFPFYRWTGVGLNLQPP